MTSENHNILWRDFPKTATEFEARFATEEDCRAYWIEARWGGKPTCARCQSQRVWTIRDGTTFECADCGHQTSLTSGTLLEKTRKPLKMWFRAIFEISTRRTGISGKDFQRIMGFGSYKTAWSWLHKLRAAMVRSDSDPLGPFVQADETLVSLPPRLIKIGARVVRHARAVTFQLAEVMISGDLFHRILLAIHRLRPSPVPI